MFQSSSSFRGYNTFSGDYSDYAEMAVLDGRGPISIRDPDAGEIKVYKVSVNITEDFFRSSPAAQPAMTMTIRGMKPNDLERFFGPEGVDFIVNRYRIDVSGTIEQRGHQNIKYREAKLARRSVRFQQQPPLLNEALESYIHFQFFCTEKTEGEGLRHDHAQYADGRGYVRLPHSTAPVPGSVSFSASAAGAVVAPVAVAIRAPSPIPASVSLFASAANTMDGPVVVAALALPVGEDVVCEARCNICFDAYNDSIKFQVALRCGHSFCFSCVNAQINDEILGLVFAIKRCPECRKIIDRAAPNEIIKLKNNQCDGNPTSHPENTQSEFLLSCGHSYCKACIEKKILPQKFCNKCGASNHGDVKRDSIRKLFQ